MQRIEGQVKTDRQQPEVPFAETLAEHLAGGFGKPVINGAEEREQESTQQHIMKMRDYEIGIAQLPVEGRRGKHDTGQSRDQELKKKCCTEEHGRRKANSAAVHCRQPVEEFDAC